MDNTFNGFNGQDELYRLLQELTRLQNNNRNRSNTPRTRTGRTNDNEELIALLREVVYSYNTNIRDYQDNTRIILQTIHLLASNTNSTNRRAPTNERRNDYYYDYSRILPYINRVNRPDTPINTFNENVIVRPTNEQFNSATIDYDFSTDDIVNNTNTRCPIVLEDFQEGDHVCKIRHCGHTFYREQIYNWFQVNVRCPVCRYDIRDYSTNNTPQQNDQSLTDEELQNTLHTRISNSLMSIIDQYYSETDLSQNLTFDFEFPVVYNDVSGNYVHLTRLI
jgi:hypothetical protein